MKLEEQIDQSIKDIDQWILYRQLAQYEHIFATTVKRKIVPAWISFSVLDYLYAPKLALIWFFMRVAVAMVWYNSQRISRMLKIKIDDRFVNFNVIIGTSIINMMIAMKGDPTTPYYLGTVLTILASKSIFNISGINYVIITLCSLIPCTILSLVYLNIPQFAMICGFIGLSFFVLIEEKQTKEQLFTKMKSISKDLVLEQNKVLESTINHQKDEIKSLNAISGGLAHEFLNSINIIKTGILGIKNSVLKSNNEKALKIVERMNRTCESTAKLLDIIRGTANISEEIKSVNLYQMVEAILLLNKGITFEEFDLRNEIDKNFEINTNEAVLFGALTNIYKNAVEANHATVEKKIVISATRNNSASIINISDFGPGVSDSIKDKIFTTFTSKKDGKGIGLSLSLKQIREIGGDICLLSHKKPTIFSVKIEEKKNEDV